MSGKDSSHISDPETRSVRVTGLSTDGRGVARVDDKAVFISGALPGDEVAIIPDWNTRPASGKLLKILTPATDRHEHPCAHAGACPASPLGYLTYARQLELKTELVERTLSKTCGKLPVKSMIASPEIWNYRNRISIRLRDENGSLQAGYAAESRGGELIPVRQCQLAKSELASVLRELMDVLTEYRGGTTDKLPVKIQLHATADGPGAMVVFPIRIHGSQRKLWRNWLAPLNLPGGIWFATGNRAGVLTAGSWIEPDEAAQPLATTWNRQLVKIHPGSFCQANAGSAESVHNKLRDWAAFSHGATVWDLYGGYGALGFSAAMRRSKVRIFEATKWSEPTAARVAELAGGIVFDFVLGDVLKEFRARYKDIREEDLLILDPPRSGAHPDLLESIVRSKVKRIAYLSCNPAKLGRDLGILMDEGFQATELQPFDFFPQTVSTEVLAFVER